MNDRERRAALITATVTGKADVGRMDPAGCVVGDNGDATGVFQ